MLQYITGPARYKHIVSTLTPRIAVRSSVTISWVRDSNCIGAAESVMCGTPDDDVCVQSSIRINEGSVVSMDRLISSPPIRS